MGITFMVVSVSADVLEKGGSSFGLSPQNGPHLGRIAMVLRSAGATPICVLSVGRRCNSDAFIDDIGGTVVTCNIGVGNELLGVSAQAVVTANSPS